MIRIIAGIHKGRNLITPKGSENTRPTLSRTRESLFSMLFDRAEHALVLDLFAGSGALGFEALSRGADQVVFCDNNRAAYQAVCANIGMLHEKDRAKALFCGWSKAVDMLSANSMRFDLIFVDPPYRMAPDAVLYGIVQKNLLISGGLIILEHNEGVSAPSVDGISVVQQRTFRDTVLTFYEMEK